MLTMPALQPRTADICPEGEPGCKAGCVLV
jgi:hypothetical protein